ncbi:response regulator transcription factor [Neiella sp. HB171785]|uniref:Response regulator transcription factor n=1 Tax=Neiella litorisoli TaxID=2771431 RepID=A0A8J6QI13_9GAMM|nr:response regulator transcription factor [Neiella litorisoli]MBD1390230.1 response regulator transcription factor [Neiella litorisoli]
MKKTVILADDHVLVAEGIKNLLAQQYDVVATVENGRELITAAKQHKPDVIVSDVSMPLLNGIDALHKLKEQKVDAKVVFLTMHPDVKYAIRALDAGAAGYVLKHSAADELLTAVDAALAGRTFITSLLAADVMEAYRQGGDTKATDPLAQLSPRQHEVLQLLAEGKTAKEVANIMNISSRTVEFHKYKMIEVLKLDNARELIKFAIENGLAATNPN